MRVALFASIFAVGCVPRLYTENSGQHYEWVAPDNDWPLTAPPDTLEPEGYAEGDVMPDFRLVDQNGDEVSLWQFYGSVVLVDVSALWCEPCKALAVFTEETYQDYKDEGFVYLTLIQEGQTLPATAEDIATWADGFGITAPVLNDGEYTGVGGEPESLPHVMVIGRNMKVRDIIEPPVEDAKVRAAIEDVL